MKKVLFITISVITLLGVWQTCQAAKLLLDYPTISGTKLTSESSIAEIIRYIYMFALGAAGFVALLAILIGAILYITSAGNPSKASDAKDRIFSAILGIIILLASVLILGIINPDLVNIGFKLPEMKPVLPTEQEVSTKYQCLYCCREGSAPHCTPNTVAEGWENCKGLTEAEADSQCQKDLGLMPWNAEDVCPDSQNLTKIPDYAIKPCTQ